MALHETEGLILKTYNLSDADKIVVLFSQNEGLIRGVAKGAKRLKSKFGGSLEPFTIVHLTYLQKEERELVSIQNIELTKSYFDHASEPRFLENFGYMVDLLIDFIPPHDPNESLYKMARACLDAGAENTKGLDRIVFYFEFWILRLGGYLPNWEACGSCSRVIDADEPVHMQLDFRLVCLDCSDARTNDREVKPRERALFLFARRLSPAEFVKITSDSRQQLSEVSGVLKRIISGVLDRDISSGKRFTMSL